jgi:hypothetical protein
VQSLSPGAMWLNMWIDSPSVNSITSTSHQSRSQQNPERIEANSRHEKRGNLVELQCSNSEEHPEMFEVFSSKSAFIYSFI